MTNKKGALAPWAGVEPATPRLGGGCSIQLSYQGRIGNIIYVDSTVIQVFTKAAILGRVKTRLIPLLGDTEASKFQMLMLNNIQEDLREIHHEIEI